MTETKPKRRWFQFTILNLLWLIALAALGAAWWADHNRQVDRIHFYQVHMPAVGGVPNLNTNAAVALLQNCSQCHSKQ